MPISRFGSRVLAYTASARADMREPLYRDAYFLMANTVMSSALGMAYWSLAPRLFPTATVGEANTMISAVLLMSAFAQLNFMQVLQRFVPVVGKNSTGFMIRAYVIALTSSFALAMFVLGVIRMFAPADYVLNVGVRDGLVIISCVMLWTLFSLQDGALIALRQAKWMFVENALFNLMKIFMLVAISFVAKTETGFFFSWFFPAALTIIPINFFLFRRLLPQHHRNAKGDEAPVSRRALFAFISGDYIGWISSQSLVFGYPMLIPLLVDGTRGKQYAAYLSIALPIATALNLISSNLVSSMMVEVAQDPANLAPHVRQIAKRMALFLVPAVLLIVVCAPWILLLGRAEYQAHATTLLRLMALGGLPIGAIILYGGIARIENRTWRIARVQLLQTLLTLAFVVILVPHAGLTGLGLSVVLGALLVSLGITPTLLRTIRSGHRPRSTR